MLVRGAEPMEKRLRRSLIVSLSVLSAPGNFHLPVSVPLAAAERQERSE